MAKALIWSPVAIVIIWCAFAFNPSTYDVATRQFYTGREYSLPELATLASFLIAAGLAAILGFRSWRTARPTILVIGYMAFSLLAFLVAMEEGQWGQPLLEYQVPQAILSQNMQGEMTLHNVESLQGRDGFFYLAFALAALSLHLPSMPFLPRDMWRAVRPDWRLLPIVVTVLVLGLAKSADHFLGNPFHPLQPIRWSSEMAEFLIGYWAMAYCGLKLLEIREL